MKIAFITNLRAPYRTLQLNEFNTIKDVQLTAFYTDRPNENRTWEIEQNNFKEIDLKGIKLSKQYGYINEKLIDIVRNYDLIILGCYEQPTYIILSILCKIFRKKYILSFDGICTDRINLKEKFFKKFLKNLVINNAYFILGNGEVSKIYFSQKFNYPAHKIYNQFLTVDSVKINELYKSRLEFRREYREKLNISLDEKVLLFSGRLIEIKNIKKVIEALKKINQVNITFVLLGGGELEAELIELAKLYQVKLVITGFINQQDELFKHYFIGDALILPSIYDVWGLVVNEAMFSGLPVIVSNICGCSLDLVKESENGYTVNPLDENDIADKIKKVLYEKKNYGLESRKIIKDWTFTNSAKNLEKIIRNMQKLN